MRAEPTHQERIAEHEHHTAPLSPQTQHEHLAGQNKENFARVNQGKPAIAATARAADFSSHSAIPARAAGAAYHPPAMSPKEARGPAVAGNRPLTPGNSGNANRPTGGTKPSPQGRSNQGFRPFTPPSKGGVASTASGNQNHPVGNRPAPANSNNANRTTGGSSPSPQNRSNGGFRPFSPPSKAGAGSPTGGNQDYANHGRVNEARPQNRPGQARPQDQSRPQNQPRPESASRPMPQARPSAPRPEQHRPSPPPPPKNQAPARDEHHKGR